MGRAAEEIVKGEDEDPVKLTLKDGFSVTDTDTRV